MEFKDYFSGHAKEYSKYRPTYPPELFEYLSSLTKQHDLALDCATGNGQAAIGLAPYFKEIIATDASSSQITHAEQHTKIKYNVATAEDSGIDSRSVDLITVATAIHWINTDKFYPEVKRILKPGGVIAVWTYVDSFINDKLDKIIKDYSRKLMKKYWTPENIKARNFEEVDFPFERIEAPDIKIYAELDMQGYMDYLFTWSSTQNYIKEKGENPLTLIYDSMKNAWGDENIKRKITWPIKIKAGRV